LSDYLEGQNTNPIGFKKKLARFTPELLAQFAPEFPVTLEIYKFWQE
jgi:hypothetical protein